MVNPKLKLGTLTKGRKKGYWIVQTKSNKHSAPNPFLQKLSSQIYSFKDILIWAINCLFFLSTPPLGYFPLADVPTDAAYMCVGWEGNVLLLEGLYYTNEDESENQENEYLP